MPKNHLLDVSLLAITKMFERALIVGLSIPFTTTSEQCEEYLTPIKAQSELVYNYMLDCMYKVLECCTPEYMDVYADHTAAVFLAHGPTDDEIHTIVVMKHLFAKAIPELDLDFFELICCEECSWEYANGTCGRDDVMRILQRFTLPMHEKSMEESRKKGLPCGKANIFSGFHKVSPDDENEK